MYPINFMYLHYSLQDNDLCTVYMIYAVIKLSNIIRIDDQNDEGLITKTVYRYLYIKYMHKCMKYTNTAIHVCLYT